MPYKRISNVQELLELIKKDGLEGYTFDILDGKDMFTNLKIVGVDLSYSSKSATIYVKEEK